MGNTARKEGFNMFPKSYIKDLKNKPTPNLSDSAQVYAESLDSTDVTDFLLKDQQFLDDYVLSRIPLFRIEEWIETKQQVTDNNPKILQFSEEDRKVLRTAETILNHLPYPKSGLYIEMDSIIKNIKKFDKNTIYNFDSHQFSPDMGAEWRIPTLVFMFEDILGENFARRSNLISFFIDLRENYFVTPFHNFRTVIYFVHSLYWVLKRCPSVFSFSEKLAMMIASSSAHIRHPGIHEDVLAAVLKTRRPTKNSSLRMAHTQACLTLLMRRQDNILRGVPSDQLQSFVEDVKLCIKATFQSIKFCEMEDSVRLIQENLDYSKRECRHAVMRVLMRSSGLNLFWKPWKIHFERIIDRNDEYFFPNGIALNKLVIESQSSMCNMDAPKDRIDEIEEQVLPVLSVCAKVFPCMERVVMSVKENMRRWTREMPQMYWF